MSRSTTEYCTLIKATSQLTGAVKNDLVQLSVELVSNQLISVDNGEELRNRSRGVVERAAKLVALVTNKVEQDKKNYYIFVRVLMNYRSTYKEVLELLEPVYSTGQLGVSHHCMNHIEIYITGRPFSEVGLQATPSKIEKCGVRAWAEISMCMDVVVKDQSVSNKLEEIGGHIYNKGACAVSTINQPWYHRRLSREEAEKRLGEMDGDSFLVRESISQSGRLILSVKNGGTFYHFFIERGVGTYEVEGTNLPFPSPAELIDYYKENGLPENDSGEIIRLNLPCNFTIPPFSNSANSASPRMMKNPPLCDQKFVRRDGSRGFDRNPVYGLVTPLPGSSTLTSDDVRASDYDYAYVSMSLDQSKNSAPEPLAFLRQQKYFHGSISRIEAEILLKKNGQFLVRESSTIPGQYVLTGMADGCPWNFLLTDEEKKVILDKSTGDDIEFKNIPELVTYLTEKKIPLIHDSGSKLILKEPVSSFSLAYRQS